ncbi:hypothetical protein R21Y_122 [Vibrio phage vB_VhaS_R21Y]|nr:hypothetical protein R21Y_122 [Vibrio phage vB_VhaS_R21Y]
MRITNEQIAELNKELPSNATKRFYVLREMGFTVQQTLEIVNRIKEAREKLQKRDQQ